MRIADNLHSRRRLERALRPCQNFVIIKKQFKWRPHIRATLRHLNSMWHNFRDPAQTIYM